MHEGIFELQSFEVCFIVCISLKIQICLFLRVEEKFAQCSGGSSIMTAESC